jgi:hypothetical protein
MSNELAALVNDLSSSLARIDFRGPVGLAQRFLPGIGPLTEVELTNALMTELLTTCSSLYHGCGEKGYPGSRAKCDIVIPGRWAIEIKLARPFGNNGKEAERWSENLLYPYPGNTSAIGDCLKLLNSNFQERKAVVVIGYEHTPPKIFLEPAVRGFELLAAGIRDVKLSARSEQLVLGLMHPHHQQARVYAWEVLGLRGPASPHVIPNQ